MTEIIGPSCSLDTIKKGRPCLNAAKSGARDAHLRKVIDAWGKLNAIQRRQGDVEGQIHLIADFHRFRRPQLARMHAAGVDDQLVEHHAGIDHPEFQRVPARLGDRVL